MSTPKEQSQQALISSMGEGKPRKLEEAAVAAGGEAPAPEAAAEAKPAAEAQNKAAEEAAEAKRKADEAAAKAAEAKRIADEAAEAKRKAEEAEVKRKAEEAAEAKRKADEAAEAQRKAEEEEKRKREEEEKRKREEEERIKREEEEKRKREEEERRKKEEEAKAEEEKKKDAISGFFQYDSAYTSWKVLSDCGVDPLDPRGCRAHIEQHPCPDWALDGHFFETGGICGTIAIFHAFCTSFWLVSGVALFFALKRAPHKQKSVMLWTTTLGLIILIIMNVIMLIVDDYVRIESVKGFLDDRVSDPNMTVMRAMRRLAGGRQIQIAFSAFLLLFFFYGAARTCHAPTRKWFLSIMFTMTTVLTIAIVVAANDAMPWTPAAPLPASPIIGMNAGLWGGMGGPPISVFGICSLMVIFLAIFRSLYQARRLEEQWFVPRTPWFLEICACICELTAVGMAVWVEMYFRERPGNAIARAVGAATFPTLLLIADVYVLYSIRGRVKYMGLQEAALMAEEGNELAEQTQGLTDYDEKDEAERGLGVADKSVRGAE